MFELVLVTAEERHLAYVNHADSLLKQVCSYLNEEDISHTVKTSDQFTLIRCFPYEGEASMDLVIREITVMAPRDAVKTIPFL